MMKLVCFFIFLVLYEQMNIWSPMAAACFLHKLLSHHSLLRISMVSCIRLSTKLPDWEETSGVLGWCESVSLLSHFLVSHWAVFPPLLHETLSGTFPVWHLCLWRATFCRWQLSFCTISLILLIYIMFWYLHYFQLWYLQCYPDSQLGLRSYRSHFKNHDQQADKSFMVPNSSFSFTTCIFACEILGNLTLSGY